MSCLFLDVLNGKSLEKAPPLWLMRQAGRYLPEYRETRAKAGSFLKLCGNPELASEVTLQPIRRFDFDAAIIFSDILTVPIALGHPVTFDEGPKLPALTPSREAVEALERDPAQWMPRLAPVYEALALTRDSLAPEKALIGFAGAPWTLAVYMAGGGNDEQKAARLWAYRDPESFSALIGLLVDCVSQHLIWQIEAGAQVVQLFDSWAEGLPFDLFAEYVAKPAAQVVEKVRAAKPDVKIIGFPRAANMDGLQHYAGVSGVDGISIAPSTSASWAVEHLGVNFGKTIQGNLDPLALIAGGEALKSRVEAILAATKGKPFIFNLGHGILPPTPIEHVHELVKLVRGGA
ncbi:uroporphyrinogen decarboxylase [Rhizomicrobium palustre]|uniref:Uroporphyrinogen decarboxylase n=1 Tax=Rhizomicrobium palustre TaxID=189966 RepID=A0A846MYZ3_9PROT|nr:uroporphyrinogen decarboxylase [Rhizomicrobium palustre]NIK88180.1 uroporphyrinogen decarboxylase [Rhizomicrobium palustre]